MIFSLFHELEIHQEIKDLCYHEVYDDNCVDSKVAVIYLTQLRNKVFNYFHSNSHPEAAKISICANSTEKHITKPSVSKKLKSFSSTNVRVWSTEPLMVWFTLTILV